MRTVTMGRDFCDGELDVCYSIYKISVMENWICATELHYRAVLVQA